MAATSVSPTTTASAPAPSAISQAGTTALGSLNNNFSTFLTLLMTQLKNQDPSSPMDSNQFTTELVQFSSVEQQINTNSNLTQLIQLSQATQIEQSAGLVGKQVTAGSSQIALQHGTGTLNFETATPTPIAISVYNAAGTVIHSDTVTSKAGANSWSWNGRNADGTTTPDGAYKATLTAVGATGAAAQVPFTVTGTATSVINNGGTVAIRMGGLSLPFSSVTSVQN